MFGTLIAGAITFIAFIATAGALSITARKNTVLTLIGVAGTLVISFVLMIFYTDRAGDLFTMWPALVGLSVGALAIGLQTADRPPLPSAYDTNPARVINAASTAPEAVASAERNKHWALG